MHSLSPKVRSFHPELSSLLFTEFVNGVLVPVKILFFFFPHFFADDKVSDLIQNSFQYLPLFCFSILNERICPRSRHNALYQCSEYFSFS